MADVVLFHHIQGLTPGVEALAGSLRDHGHEVHTPDLFDGRTFDSIEAGAAFAEPILFGELITRAQAAVEPLSRDMVYAGISMGCIFAEWLSLTRPGARGAILLESTVPVAAFPGAEDGLEWPPRVPFQIHGMDNDPFFAGEGDIETAREMVTTLPAGQLFIYPGDVHLFCDASLESYDPGAASLVLERIEEFLERADGSA